MAISAIIPVIAVGWFYGFKMGICAAILSFPINTLMYELFGIQWFPGMVKSGGGVAGTFGLIIIGAAVGRIRDLSKHLRRELYERKRVEKELETHRDKLGEMVKLKTEELQMSNKNLKETKDHLDNIIESSLDSIIVSDSVGNVTRVNKYFLDIFGYREEEVLGKHTMEFTPMNKEGTYESTTGELIHVGNTQ
ncbi:MAG: PAS domain S-box protein [Deltaproteobacteria bacterium]|nr:PAS domain S-box protein [Deltaproteobacteria bacterium]